MTEDSILPRIEQIAGEVFGRDDISFTRDSTAEDVDEWESITHMQLIVAIEREYGMRFSASDLANLNNVGDLLDTVMRKAKRG